MVSTSIVINMCKALSGARDVFSTNVIHLYIHLFLIHPFVRPSIHPPHSFISLLGHSLIPIRRKSVLLAIPCYQSSLQIMLLNDFFSHLSPTAQLTNTIIFQTREKQARTKSAELLKKELQNEENLKSSEYLSKVSSKGTVSVFK